MLHTADICLAAVILGINSFMVGIQDSVLYTILPKYLSNQSIIESVNSSNHFPNNSTKSCYKGEPQYVIISQIFLAQSLTSLISNPVIGIVIDKFNNYLILLISQTCGIGILLIFAFNNTVLFYVIGRIIEAIISSSIFLCGYSLISKLFLNTNVRSQCLAVFHSLYFLSNSIGPFYGAQVDDKLGKTEVFVILIPVWCICIILTIVLYWRVKKNLNFRKKSSNEEIETDIKDTTEIKIDLLNSDNLTPTNENIVNTNKISVKRMHKCAIIFKMLKDPLVLACLCQIFLTNLTMFSFPSTLPSWMAYKLCSTEVQQGMVWTFGFLGYILAVLLIVVTHFYFPKWQLIAPMVCQIVFGILLIVLPLSSDWRMLFLPIMALYFTVGIVEQVVYPLISVIADHRFKSNYGTISSLILQAETISSVIGTLSSGYFAENLGFPTLAVSLGVVTILFSPISFVHQRFINSIYRNSENNQ